MAWLVGCLAVNTNSGLVTPQEAGEISVYLLKHRESDGMRQEMSRAHQRNIEWIRLSTYNYSFTWWGILCNLKIVILYVNMIKLLYIHYYTLLFMIPHWRPAWFLGQAFDISKKDLGFERLGALGEVLLTFLMRSRFVFSYHLGKATLQWIWEWRGTCVSIESWVETNVNLKLIEAHWRVTDSLNKNDTNILLSYRT